VKQFFALNVDFAGCDEPEPDFVSANGNHGDADVIPNEDAFPYFPRQL
jgi:hypothetical protein